MNNCLCWGSFSTKCTWKMIEMSNRHLHPFEVYSYIAYEQLPSNKAQSSGDILTIWLSQRWEQVDSCYYIRCTLKHICCHYCEKARGNIFTGVPGGCMRMLRQVICWVQRMNIDEHRVGILPNAPSVRSPDSAAKSPIKAFPGASLIPLLILSKTFPAAFTCHYVLSMASSKI